MSTRNLGDIKFPNNFQVTTQAALDPRLVVETKAELYLASTWPKNAEGTSIFIYNGMVVSVNEDNSLYMLVDLSKYDTAEGWQRIDSAAAKQVEVVNNLTSTDTDKALSANQGKVLNDAITTNADDIATLKGDENTEGSIANQIKSAKDELNDAITEVDNNVTALSERVDGVEESIETTINDKLSSLTDVYIYKGTVETFEDLPESTEESPLVTGYVYNVKAANGNIPAGTNYAWNGETEEWDALGGEIDLSAYAKSEDVTTEIENAISDVNSDIETIQSTITEHTTDLTGIKTDIADIKTKNTEYDSSISAIETAIDTLNGDDETEGSVDAKIKSLHDSIGSEYVGIPAYNEKVSAIDSSIGSVITDVQSINNKLIVLEGDEETEGSVKNTVSTLLVDYVEKEDGKSLISDEKLTLIDTNASDIAALQTSVNNLNTSVGSLSTSLTGTSELVATHTEKLSELDSKLTWATLDV